MDQKESVLRDVEAMLRQEESWEMLFWRVASMLDVAAVLRDGLQDDRHRRRHRHL